MTAPIPVSINLPLCPELLRSTKTLNPISHRTIITATYDLKMIDVSDRIFWIRDGKVDRIETRAEVAVGAVVTFAYTHYPFS